MRRPRPGISIAGSSISTSLVSPQVAEGPFGEGHGTQDPRGASDAGQVPQYVAPDPFGRQCPPNAGWSTHLGRPRTKPVVVARADGIRSGLTLARAISKPKRYAEFTERFGLPGPLTGLPLRCSCW